MSDRDALGDALWGILGTDNDATARVIADQILAHPWLAEHDRQERERCARIAEGFAGASPDDVDEAHTTQYALGHANGINNVVEAIANDIRALSNDRSAE